MALDRPGVQTDRIGKARTVQHIVAAQLVGTADPPRFAHAELRADVDQLRALEAGHLGAQEAQVLDHLAAALDFAGAELHRIGGIHRAPLRIGHLRDVDPPLAASPEASMNLRARIARRPDLVSTSTASMRPASIAAPTSSEWNNTCAPAASSS